MPPSAVGTRNASTTTAAYTTAPHRHALKGPRIAKMNSAHTDSSRTSPHAWYGNGPGSGNSSVTMAIGKHAAAAIAMPGTRHEDALRAHAVATMATNRPATGLASEVRMAPTNASVRR